MRLDQDKICDLITMNRWHV